MSDPRRFRHVLALLCVVVAIAVMAGTMVGVALPIIGRDFDATEGVYGWVVTGYVLTFGVFNAIHGRLSDTIGVRRLYVAGLTLFGLAGLTAGLAPNLGVVIAARAVQGVGAAAIPVMGSTIVTRMAPPESRGAAMGWILSTVGIGASIGPTASGAILSLMGWRPVFFFTALILLAVPLAWHVLPEQLDERSDEQFDWVGATLLTAGISLLLYALQIVHVAGITADVLAYALAGLSALFALRSWMRRVTTPLFPAGLFRTPTFLVTCVVAFLTNAARFGVVVSLPILLIKVFEIAPIWVGLALLPDAVALALLSPRAGRFADVYGARRPARFGALSMAAGCLVAAFAVSKGPFAMAATMLFFGVGFSSVQSPLVSAASRVLPDDQTGPGLGVFMMIFFLGGAFGVALALSVIELWAGATTSWFGLVTGPTAPFSNAMLALLPLALAAVLLCALVPTRAET